MIHDEPQQPVHIALFLPQLGDLLSPISSVVEPEHGYAQDLEADLGLAVQVVDGHAETVIAGVQYAGRFGQVEQEP
jgi:hypothetical protein